MKSIRSICVFCASSSAVAPVFLTAAYELGRCLGREDIDLVYGGASIGLMGEVARGVHQENGKVVGVLPKFFKIKEIEYGDADELIVTRDMRERKAVMDERSDAFIALPGGVGTLEEAVEILSMIQLRLTRKPLVFVNTRNFYGTLLEHFQNLVDWKFAKAETLNLFAMVNTPAEAVQAVKEHRPPGRDGKWL